jgi:FkbM family methyltransferase
LLNASAVASITAIMLSLSGQSKIAAGREGAGRRFARWLRWRLPKSVKQHRIWSGQLRGRTIVTSWRDYPAGIVGITEPQLLKWFGAHVTPGSTWLDVGAHYGYTVLSLAMHVGSDGRVFAFEPMLASAGCLERTRLLNGLSQVVVCPFALGSRSDFSFETIPVVRGMADRTITGSQATWVETILVAGFDGVWERLNGGNSHIDGIKIDVQGMELDVLKGMCGVLKHHRPQLVIELHRGVDRTEVLSLLSECGYSLDAIPIEPVPGEIQPQFVDDRSYAFVPLSR